MKKNKYLVPLIFLGIIILAIILRLWNLGVVPVSLNWDEVSWGYNALSLVETGRDEFGRGYPVVIQSLNDFKPALYLYLVAPLIYVFGLSDLIVRLPNAIAGIIAVITTYFLVKELFKDRRDIALLSSFLLAVSPWAIQFSRYAHEGMLSLSLLLLMVLFLLKSLGKPKYLYLASFFAAISIYSYQGVKLFMPLLIIIFIISFYKEFKKIPRKHMLLSVILGFILVFPMLFHVLSTPDSLSRVSATSISNGPEILNEEFYSERAVSNSERGDLPGKLFDNKRLLVSKAIVGNYLSHYDINFLFVKDEGIGNHQPPNMAHIYILWLPFFLIGLYYFIFGKYKKSTKIFVFAWLLIVPLGAAFTWDVPNSGRTIYFLPIFQIIIAIGILSAFYWLMKLKIMNILKYMIIAGFAILFIFNFAFYLNQYFSQYNYFNSREWQYGYDDVVEYLEENYSDEKTILVSSTRPMDQSYIFFLYQTRFDPSEYQKNPNQDFKNYKFIDTEEFDWQSIDENQIVVLPSTVLPAELHNNVQKTFKYLNGEDSIIVVKR